MLLVLSRNGLRVCHSLFHKRNTILVPKFNIISKKIICKKKEAYLNRALFCMHVTTWMETMLPEVCKCSVLLYPVWDLPAVGLSE